MKVRALHLAVLCFCLTLSASAQRSLKLVDPLEPIYPDSNALAPYGLHYSADFPSGTLADVHVVLQAVPGERCVVSADIDGKSVPQSCWSVLRDVPVEENTGLDSRTEQFTGQHNPYVVRRAPFRIYEVIEPMVASEVTVLHPFTGLRLAIPSAALGGAGSKMVRITVRGSDWRLEGVFTAAVHAASVPDLKNGRFFFTNWFNMTQMEERHNVKRWTPEWAAMLDRYAGMMAHGRQNCINLPGELLSLADGRITLDEKNLLLFIDTFRRHGFRYFEAPHLLYRGDEDDYGDPELKVGLTKHRYYTEGGKKEVDTIVALMKEFCRRHDLANGWLQHIMDEPGVIQAKCYRDCADQVRAVFPGVKIMDAVSTRDTLAGAIDIWCPTIDDYQGNEGFFRERQKMGEQVLVYTCLVPGGPWMNRLLDQERLRPVYFGWAAAANGTFGFLHWGLNQYCVPDPFEQSVVHHPSPVATPNNFLPAGDTHILYPGPEGPLSSTRFEAFRMGIEDFELLSRLPAGMRTEKTALIRQLFLTYTDYVKDPVRYRRARKTLLEYSN
jgi:hypothetical protein